MDSAGTLTWSIPKKEISIQKNSYTYPRKNTFFQRKYFLHSPESTDFLPLRKNFLYLSEKIINFPPEEKFLMIARKNNFTKKKFLYLSEKTDSCTFAKKLKCFIADVF